MSEFILILGFAVLGTLIGCITGLIPGIHVNNLALILLGVAPSLLVPLSSLSSSTSFVLLLLCVLILSTSIAHTFLDFIPTTFLGAPDAESCLVALPAHQMLLKGKGYQAVALSAKGSFCAVLFGFAFLLPFKFLIQELNFYHVVSQNMALLLLSIAFLLIISETARIRYKRAIIPNRIIPRKRLGRDKIENLKIGDSCAVHGVLVREGKNYVLEECGKSILVRAREKIALPEGVSVTIEGVVERVPSTFSRTLGVALALSLFLISGLFGTLILRMQVSSPLNLPTSPLFPALTGLFGIATLLFSYLSAPQIPEQRIEEPRVEKKLLPTFSGTLAGSTLAFLPGLTGAHATILSTLGRKKDNEQTILTLSAVNTSYAFFCLAALFLILKPRNGAMLVIERLFSLTPWQAMMPTTLAYLLIAVLVAAVASYFLTLKLGKSFARIFERMNYKLLVGGVTLFVSLTVFLFAGGIGLLILAVGTAIGLFAPMFGIRRSHAMGVLLLPILLNLLGGL